MPLTRLTYGKSWLDSEDFPTYEADEEQVRLDMQYHPDAIKTYVNGTLLKELESENGAGSIGDGQKGNVEASLQAAFQRLQELADDIGNLAVGDTPEAVRSRRVEFTAAGWAEEANSGDYTLRILSSQHKRGSDAFGYKLQHLVNGRCMTGTWAVMGTDVSYEESSGDVVLTGRCAYDGVITFFGV